MLEPDQATDDSRWTRGEALLSVGLVLFLLFVGFLIGKAL